MMLLWQAQQASGPGPMHLEQVPEMLENEPEEDDEDEKDDDVDLPVGISEADLDAMTPEEREQVLALIQAVQTREAELAAIRAEHSQLLEEAARLREIVPSPSMQEEVCMILSPNTRLPLRSICAPVRFAYAFVHSFWTKCTV